MQLKDHEMLIGLLGGEHDILPGTGSAVGSSGLEVPFRITEAVAVDGIEYEHFVATGLFVGNQSQWPMPTERPMVEVLKRLRLMSDRSASGYVSRVIGDGTGMLYFPLIGGRDMLARWTDSSRPIRSLRLAQRSLAAPLPEKSGPLYSQRVFP